MNQEGRLATLLARYVDRRLQGAKAPGAEELCASDPDLLEPLRSAIERYEDLAQQLSDSDSDSGVESAYIEAVRQLGVSSPASVGEPTLTAAAGDLGAGLRPGRTLGGRYRIRSRLGAGGMGEVWLAYDLKLRVEVALKALRPEFFESSRRRDLLRREVRLARQVVSPHVCRVFDLIFEEGLEMVSMEFVDGDTLAAVLADRGPLALREAGEIACQLLSGLEAIHAAELVHRDLKPENVMITRSRRVVVMDLGIARPPAGGGGTVAGTPAYMAPEQLAGERVDARSDVFSCGMVLGEMVYGVPHAELLEALREDPPRVPDGPWQTVIARAVARDPSVRFDSAASLGRALEEVTLRQSDSEERRPYPGLSAFTEADAEHFYGREAEVETLWRKLQQAHLLALVGPSGAGKSSFVRAGLLPASPIGWRAILCRPGDAPLVALAQALVPEVSGDTEALQELLRFSDPEVALRRMSEWRQRHREALLVFDQFEELFTLNPTEAQASFAELLGRLTLEADVRVLLVLRDDFLMRCHQQPPLRPVFSELTPLRAPAGEALRRALVQPAASCGYRFEDEEMVEEMLADVREERGALPLLAFAAAKLWDLRYREGGLLTRSAYEQMGGITGALAGHAEETLERIGEERVGVVRELFQNLVTAEGTRATRDRDELLSVFENRDEAAAVLDQLVDARLLTSFEIERERTEDAETEPRRRVEIVHESLLEAWPRLVRWQTQDADSAQLRDQLRQAASLWESRDRSEDLLWTGSAYGEYRLWRDRYPGGLTAQEEAFGAAMEERAGRLRRRRRVAVAAAFVALLAVLAVVGIFWARSEQARSEAVAQSRRVEAGRLLALGRLELETYPTAALAHAVASLELVDHPDARRLALEAMSQGPPVIIVDETSPWGVAFSPDGRWLAGGTVDGTLRVWSSAGGPPSVLPGRARADTPALLQFDSASERLVTMYPFEGLVRVWRVPAGPLLRNVETPKVNLADGVVLSAWLVSRAGGDRLITARHDDDRIRLEETPLEGIETSPLGSVPLSSRFLAIDRAGRLLAHADGEGGLWVLPLPSFGDERGRYIGHHGDDLFLLAFTPSGGGLVSYSPATTHLWSLAGNGAGRDRVLPGTRLYGAFDPREDRFALPTPDQTKRVWNLKGPPDGDPLVLRRGRVGEPRGAAFHPQGRWLATGDVFGIGLWAMREHQPTVLRTGKGPHLAFAPDGRWLATASMEGSVHIWPLSPEGGRARVLLEDPFGFTRLAVSPDGRQIAAGSNSGTVYVAALDGTATQTYDGFAQRSQTLAFGPRGRLLAVGGGGDPRDWVLRVWDLKTGEVQVLEAEDSSSLRWARPRFTPRGELVSSGGDGEVLLWDLTSGTSKTLWSHSWYPDMSYALMLSQDGQSLLLLREGARRMETLLYDLVRGEAQRLEARFPGGTESRASRVVLSRSTSMAAVGYWDGAVRVGSLTSGEPHLLLGHEATISYLAFSPDERWLASSDISGVIRLSPIPQGEPLHTRAHAELLEHLKGLTNLRVVVDVEGDGYRLEAEAFPGWD